MRGEAVKLARAASAGHGNSMERWKSVNGQIDGCVPSVFN